MHSNINEIGETLPLNDAMEVTEKTTINYSKSSSSFPFSIDKRFKYVSHLGRGGTGLIFQAYDQQLQRHVALKFLMNPSESNRQKLVAEARAQANVEHAFICPIYEVVESQHGVYLVMQFIEGKTLQEFSPELSLEQLLSLFSKIALGLQAAHAQGLIHRDFKPGNIMINQAQGLTPQIVDFGLAQQRKDSPKNQPNAFYMAGTEGFIAPENTLKSDAKIDRRVDIYAFGATLQYCLLGSLISTNSDSELIHALAQTSLPKDIQIIIAKCMAFSPSNRYPSAKIISEELSRYLMGEPIKARPGKGYWLQRKIKKHRWITFAISLAVVGITAMYAKQQYQAHWQTLREQALLQFNGQLNALENDAQLTYMSPRHNIEPKLKEWQSEAQRLTDNLANTPDNLKFATHYAIGRIYHVLGRSALAIEHLTVAATDSHLPDAPFYLALSYGALYSQELDKLRNISDQKTRLARIAQLDQKLKQPAVTLLSQHLAAAPFQSYAYALLAYYQRDWDSALSALEQSQDLPPWFYLDDALKGDILLAKAIEMHEKDGKNAEVLPLVEQAKQHFARSISVAPSDPIIAAKPLSYGLFELVLLNQAGMVATAEQFRSLERDFQQALMINANNGELWQIYGEILQTFAMNLHYNNGDPMPVFAQAEQHLTRAIEVGGAEDSKWFSLSRLHASKVKHLRESNQDAQQSIAQTLDALRRISPQSHDYHYFNQFGTLNRYRAQHAVKQGQNAETYFAQAIKYYLKANQHSPDNIGSLINAASTLRKQSEHTTPSERLQALRQAQTWLSQVVQKQPKHFVANYYLAVIGVDLVELSLYRQAPIDNAIPAAQAQLTQTKQVNNTHPYILDLAQKLKQFELESLMTRTQTWVPAFDEMVTARRALASRFANNALVTRNYVGVLAGVTGYRIALNLPAQSYVAELEQAIKNYPNIENGDAYRALAELFAHWQAPDLAKRQLINKYRLRDTQSFAHQWALYLTLIATADKETSLQEGVALAEQDTGMLPIYRQWLITWGKTRLGEFAPVNQQQEK